MAYYFHTKDKQLPGGYYCFHTETLEEGLNYLMQNLFNTIGNGDMENGGVGSLWRCAREIYDILASGTRYTYADYSCWVTLENDEPLTRKNDEPTM